ncbi:MAG: hypothetical protein IPL70_16465 [Uliginosibacterium sp.]|nr:hypothetical protein [Uliginosibacterium sp.]
MAACEGFPKHHAPLRAWALKFDAKNLAPIKISERACLLRTEEARATPD